MQTCKKLRDVTDARVIWINFAAQYSLRHLQNPSSGTRPLHTLPTDEIRRWIEKRLATEEIWRKKSIIHPRSRTLKRFSKDLRITRIIPGGRWLLAGAKYGLLYYYDLDIEDPEPIRLIGPDPKNRIPGDSQRVAFLDFFVEPGYPPSEFTIGFVGGCACSSGCCQPNLTCALFRRQRPAVPVDPHLACQG